MLRYATNKMKGEKCKATETSASQQTTRSRIKQQDTDTQHN